MLASRVRDVDPAGALDALGVDRAAEPGLEPVGSARKVDARALVLGHGTQRGVEGGEGRLGIGGQRLAALGHAERLADQAERVGRRLEAAVDEDVGDARLRLHAVREIGIGVAHRAEIEDEVGLQRQHALEVRLAAPPGQPAGLGQVAVRYGDIGPLLGPQRARPAEQALGLQRIDQDRGGQARGEDTFDPLGDLDHAPGRIGDLPRRSGSCEQDDQQREDQPHWVASYFAAGSPGASKP